MSLVAPPAAPSAPPADARVPFSRKLLWGAGGAADNIMYNGLSALVLPIFNLGLGVDAVLLGYAMGIPRLLDAITDPLIGNLSDNTRSRWGRRRPYILCGAIGAGVLLATLFNPGAGWSTDVLFWWFLILCSLFYVAYTFFMIPYSALGFELTTDYAERTRVLAWRPYLGFASGLAIPWLYKLCFVFGENEVEGVRVVAVLMGITVIALGLLPALFVPEPPAPAIAPAPLPLLQSLRVTFTNPAFLLLAGATLCILLGLFLAGPLGLYLSMFYVFGGDKEAAATIGGWAGVAGMLAGYVGLPLATWYSARFGKRHAALLFVGIATLSIPLTWWLFTPANPWLMLVPAVIIGITINGAFLVGVSMLADVCDADELRTGLRREGIYSASMEFGKKCAIALSTVLGGYLLAVAGFDQSQATQTESTLTALRLGYILVLGLAFLTAFLLFRRFPLTHESAREIRRQLDARRPDAAQLRARRAQSETAGEQRAAPR